MKSVFEASTSLDAYMILNLLEQEGIVGRVEGEYLQGGVGELPAVNVVRVVVPDDSCAAARKIISDWEAVQPPPDQEAAAPATRSAKGFLQFVLGAAVGIGGMYWAFNTPVTRDGIDYDRDGVLDVRWIYKDDLLSMEEVDRNHDGRVDVANFYNRQGLIDHTEADDNFDGIFESRFKYNNGTVSIMESDLNNDGNIDYRVHYEYGVLNRAEIIGPEYRSPGKRQVYKMNKLVSAEYDSDGDGVYDKQYEYDYYEEPTEKK